jgi:hypothetical protein
MWGSSDAGLADLAYSLLELPSRNAQLYINPAIGEIKSLNVSLLAPMALHILPKRAPQTLRAPLTRRFMTSPRTASYADTLPNLKIGAHTRVLFQGFTGKRLYLSPSHPFSQWNADLYRATSNCQCQGVPRMGH